MALTGRKLLFAEALASGKSATVAYGDVGYSVRSARTLGPRLANDPEIVEFLADIKKSAAERLGITQEWLLGEFKKNFERCANLVPVRDRKGDQVFIEGPEGQQVPAYTMYDPKAASKFGEMIGKHLKMFTDKVEVGNSDNEPFMTTPVTAEEASRWYQEKMRRS